MIYSVTSAAGAAASNYAVRITGSDSANAARSALADGTYTVLGDTTPPTAPTALTALAKRGQVNLSWQPSSDNVKVTGYQVRRNGSVVALVTGTGWVDSPPVAGSTNVYSVVAHDAAGNASAASNSVSVTTSSPKGKPR